MKWQLADSRSDEGLIAFIPANRASRRLVDLKQLLVPSAVPRPLISRSLPVLSKNAAQHRFEYLLFQVSDIFN
jgi:hypothetical protein